jgi:hypothetical protein
VNLRTNPDVEIRDNTVVEPMRVREVQLTSAEFRPFAEGTCRTNRQLSGWNLPPLVIPRLRGALSRAVCFDAGNATPCRTVQDQNLSLMEGSGRTSFAICLASKVRKEHLECLGKQGIWEMPAKMGV